MDINQVLTALQNAKRAGDSYAVSQLEQLANQLGGPKESLAPQVPEIPMPPPEGGFIPSVKRGFLETGILLGDILPAMAARAVGADEYAEKQFREAAETQRKIEEKYAPAIASYSDIKGLGDAIKYAVESVGELIPSMIPSLFTGGVAGVAGRGAIILAKEAAEAAVKKEFASMGAEALAKAGGMEALQSTAMQAGIDAAKKVAIKYEAAGAISGSAAQNIPEVYKGIKDETGQESLGAALMFGGFNSLLDAALPLSLLIKLKKSGVPTDEVIGSWYKRFGVGAAKGFATEGGTEAAQEMSSAAAEKFVDNNKEFFTEKNLERFLNAGLKGGLGGGVVSGSMDVALGKKNIDEVKDLYGDIYSAQRDILNRRVLLDELRHQEAEEKKAVLGKVDLNNLGIKSNDAVYNAIIGKDLNIPEQAAAVLHALSTAAEDPNTRDKSQAKYLTALDVIGGYLSYSGEPDVGQTISKTGGEGVEIPSGTVAPAATEGVAGTERGGVVPAVTDVRQPSLREGVQPAPLTQAEVKPEAPIVQETLPQATEAVVAPAPAPKVEEQPPVAPAAPVEKPAPITTRQLIEEQEVGIAKQTERFQSLLQEQVRRYGLNDVAVNVVDDLKNANGQYSKGLIKLAIDADDPVRDLRHESIHAMKELGLFTQAQWLSLTDMANKNWVNFYLKSRDINGNPVAEGKPSRYDAYVNLFKKRGMSEQAIQDALIEEAIADAFGYFRETKAPPGMLNAILNRINNFFKAIKETVGLHKGSAEDIFRHIEKRGKKAEPVKAEKKEIPVKKVAPEVKKEEKEVEKKPVEEFKPSLRADTPEFKQWFGDSKVVDDNGNPLIVYHGTKRDFSSFKAKYPDGLFFFSTNPKFASKWAVGYGGKGDLREPPADSVAQYEHIKQVEKSLYDKYMQPTESYDFSTDAGRNQFDADRSAFKNAVKKETGYSSAIEYESHAGNRVMPVYLSIQKPFDATKNYKDMEPFLRKQGMGKLVDDGYHKTGNWIVYENKPAIDELKRLGYDGIWISEDTNGPQETIAAFSSEQIKSAIGNVGAYGQRPVTEKEAKYIGMTKEEAAEAQKKGDIRLSLRAEPAELREFIKDSKAVNEEGRPLVYYGGSLTGERVYRPGVAGAIVFSPRPDVAGKDIQYKLKELATRPGEYMPIKDIRAATAKLRQYVYDTYGRQSALAKNMLSELTDIEDAGKKTGVYKFTGELGDVWRGHEDGLGVIEQQLLTGRNVSPVYINTTNPFDYADKKQVTAVLRQMSSSPKAIQMMIDKGVLHLAYSPRWARTSEERAERQRLINEHYKDNILAGDWKTITSSEVQEAIHNLEHDGFYVSRGGAKNIAVYNSKQVKSAIGNIGAYGVRALTANEADALGMTEEQAKAAQEEGDVLLSIRAETPEFKQWFGDSKIVNEDGTPKLMYHGTAKDYGVINVSRRQAGAIFLTDDPKFAERFAKDTFAKNAAHAEDILSPEQIKLARKNAIAAIRKDYKSAPEGKVMIDSIGKGYKEATAEAQEYLRTAYKDYLPAAPNIIPVYVRAVNPFDFKNPEHIAEFEQYEKDNRYTERTVSDTINDIKRGNWEVIESKRVQDAIKSLGHDGFYVMEDGRKSLAVYKSDQLKSSVGNVGAYGQRKITSEEARAIGMTAEEASEAQKRGDIRFSLRADTPEFKQWFGDSKVVDAKGNPLVMYHGAKQDIEGGIFRMEKGMLGSGAYFTSNPKEAEFYTSNATWRTDANIVPSYISIKNPYYTKDKWDKGAIKAKENGYDGVILLAPNGKDIDWAIPFSSHQIKSAIGNIGAYGQRPVTAEEAKRLGMTEEEAKAAQARGDIRLSLRSAVGAFDQQEIENNRVPDYKSQNKLIEMPIDDFLALSEYIDPKSKESKYKFDKAMALLDSGKQFSSLPYLYIDENGRVTGHEGRHRGMALKKHGYQTMPVSLRSMIRWSEQYDSKKFDYREHFPAKLKAQTKALNPNFTVQFPVKREDAMKPYGQPIERLSLRSQINPAITARMLQTTTSREENTDSFIGRMLRAISPESVSEFRAHAIHRYNALGEADKLKIQKMGGIELFADENSESAALMSDVSAGIVAGALGAFDKIGGIPTYHRHYVVEKKVTGPRGDSIIRVGGRIADRRTAEALARQQNGVVREHGHVSVVSNPDVSGPLKIFSKLAERNDPDIYRFYQFWAGVKRAEKWIVTPQGQVVKEKLFSPDDIKYARELERQFPEFVTIQKEWTKYNDGLVKLMLDAGVISKQNADEFIKHGDYMPFYRQILGEENAVGPQIFQSIYAVKAPRKIQHGESPLGDFLENIVRNTQAAVQASVKNIAAMRARDVGMDVGLVDRVAQAQADPVNSFYVLEDGKKTFYNTSDHLFINAIKSLSIPDLPFMGLLSAPANVLRALVTKDPGFMLANMMRDSMSAWVTSGVDMLPIAATIKNFASAVAGSSPEFKALQMGGVIGGYDYSQGTINAAKRFGKELRKQSKTMTAGEKLAAPFTSLWDALEHGTEASDAATRIEVYKKTLKDTNNEAEALFRALEVMNFNRKGSSPIIRILTAAVPFLNARIQGLDVLYRAALGRNATSNAKEIQKAFWIRGMTIAALSSMYWMLTHDDKDYKKQEQETKDNNWLFPSLGIKIPIPFEVGVLFKVIPERICALVFGDDTAKDFTKSMFRNLTSTLYVTPIPQALMPIVEAEVNYSFFTGRSIVNHGMESLASQYQIGPGTSRMAEALGSTFGMSPMLIDHVLKGYTGTMGVYMSDLIDSVWDMHTDNPKASKRFEQMPVFKRFLVDPEARGNLTAYYDMKNAVDEAVRTSNMLERTSNFEEYGKYMKDNMKMFAVKPYILDVEKSLKEIRDYKSMVRNMRMDADQKERTLTSLGKMENQLVSNIDALKRAVNR